MKATIEFSLPEEQDEHDLFMKARDMHCVLYDLATRLRCTVKYEENVPPEVLKYVEELREWLHGELNDSGISL